jgi:hypothetical protein
MEIAPRRLDIAISGNGGLLCGSFVTSGGAALGIGASVQALFGRAKAARAGRVDAFRPLALMAKKSA